MDAELRGANPPATTLSHHPYTPPETTTLTPPSPTRVPWYHIPKPWANLCAHHQAPPGNPPGRPPARSRHPTPASCAASCCSSRPPWQPRPRPWARRALRSKSSKGHRIGHMAAAAWPLWLWGSASRTKQRPRTRSAPSCACTGFAARCGARAHCPNWHRPGMGGEVTPGTVEHTSELPLLAAWH